MSRKPAPARLDADRTAKPKTCIVASRIASGNEGTCWAPPGDTYVAEDGTKIPLIERSLPNSGKDPEEAPKKQTGWTSDYQQARRWADDTRESVILTNYDGSFRAWVHPVQPEMGDESTPDGGADENKLQNAERRRISENAITMTGHGETVRLVTSADSHALYRMHERIREKVRAETIEACADLIERHACACEAAAPDTEAARTRPFARGLRRAADLILENRIIASAPIPARTTRAKDPKLEELLRLVRVRLPRTTVEGLQEQVEWFVTEAFARGRKA